jgi:hypothetical protein
MEESMDGLRAVALAAAALWLVTRLLSTSIKPGPACDGCGLELPTNPRSTADLRVAESSSEACPQCGRDTLSMYVSSLEEPWSY